MATEKPEPHTEYHKGGTVRARGQMLNGLPSGYWEWFRRNGVRMRSGYFAKGEPVGEWINYDQKGEVDKITVMKDK